MSDRNESLTIFTNNHWKILETVNETERRNIEQYNSENGKTIKPVLERGDYDIHYNKYDIAVRFLSAINAFEYMKEAEKIFPGFKFVYTLNPGDYEIEKHRRPRIAGIIHITDHRFD